MFTLSFISNFAVDAN